jgi:predicted O-methyltransferase YrrM
MDAQQYDNIAKAWEYIENYSLTNDDPRLAALRKKAQEEGLNPTSSAQAGFLQLQMEAVDARSIIVIGTSPIIETAQLIDFLSDKEGLLTVVDSSSQSSKLLRTQIDRGKEHAKAKLRLVSSPAADYLPKLNADDYDAIIVTGNSQNYRPAYEQAARLLHSGGLVIFTDATASFGPDDGATKEVDGGVMNPANRSEKATTMRALLGDLKEDPDFTISLIPVGTGMLLALKK